MVDSVLSRTVNFYWNIKKGLGAEKVLLAHHWENKMRRSAYKIKFISFLLSVMIFTMSMPGLLMADEAKSSGTENFVTRCYDLAFGRLPDESGFTYWTNRLTTGDITGSGVACLFVTSPEYEQRKTSDKDYIRDLYMLFMGREPDQSGFSFWTSKIGEWGRGGVFDGFANSEEFYDLCVENGITAGYYSSQFDFEKLQKVNLFVNRFYDLCFGRLGDMGGQKYWVENLLSGKITGSDCAAFFVNSKEFKNLALSDEDYVEALYHLFMNRASEKDGKAYWVGQLANGVSRDKVLEGFASAPEFQNICDGYGIEKGTYTAKNLGTGKKKPTPTAKPTVTSAPTAAPTLTSTVAPTVAPTATSVPTVTATKAPTGAPTAKPTVSVAPTPTLAIAHMPDVIGMAVEDAEKLIEEELAKDGLTPMWILKTINTEDESLGGNIVETEPKAGAFAHGVGPTVDVTLYIGALDITPTPTATPVPSVEYLELDGKKETFIKTTEPVYFETEFAYVFVEADVNVRGDSAKIIDDIFRANEKNTGLSYKNHFNADFWNMTMENADEWKDIDSFYFEGVFAGVPKNDHTKYSVFIVNGTNHHAEPCAYSRAVIIEGCDIDWGDDFEGPTAIALPHELLHVLHVNNGFYFGASILNEGFTTSYAQDCIKAVENYELDEQLYKENYGYIHYEITEENAEKLFLDGFSDGWDEYLYGYRLMAYLRATYGDKCFADLLKVSNTYSPDEEWSSDLSRESSAKALKQAFGETVFTDFANWYQANKEAVDC